MAQENRTTLKGYFNTGNKPTESQYSDLIDSFLNLSENDDILNASTIDNDTTKVLSPDGAGNFQLRAESSGSPFRIISNSSASTSEFGSSGADEYMTVTSNNVKVAEFGDGATHSKLILDPDQNFGVTTGVGWGDGDTVIYELSDDYLVIRVGGFNLWRITANFLGDNEGTGGAINKGTASSSFTTVIPRQFDSDTGLGWNANDQLSIIAGGIEAIRIEEANNEIILKYNWHTSITASTTQSQGEQVLISSRNEISTVANANDVVTMPSADEGREVVIVNNGANILQIFPSSGDDLGSGVDTSVTLAAGSTVVYEAYDMTNWIQK